MENPNYIPLEQDLINLSNKLKTVEGLVDIEALKAYGRCGYMYDRHYIGFDKRRSRQLVRQTMRNAHRMLIAIRKKLTTASNPLLLDEALLLSFKMVELQYRLI